TVNGRQTTDFINTAEPARGLSPEQNPASGYIGVQAHSGRVAFRNVRVKALVTAPPQPGGGATAATGTGTPPRPAQPTRPGRR
ncbi:MAG TPA: family 16 glycoside hydrolase, partial [Gemmatimonadaceae bacterium]|nr:family 16 glycoside hydrolase [Gemmatimonadaceae bacterium]